MRIAATLTLNDADRELLQRQQTPAQLDLHLIVDNYATHKHPKVLARGLSGILDFTCTSNPPAVRG